ncbi:unnamed protein product [Thlaspi arvense]|uniref:Alkyl transferase n=1 Tax=Thlaspi arvense TaxID=13288 RepID=A0AAU9SDC6_THLAR|nr:unnamed protein product [Thlaspi arvense]
MLRLSIPLSLTNIRRFIKTAASQYIIDEEERWCASIIHSGTIGEKEKQGRKPKNVAIILDGNRRWAKKRGVSVWEGHEAGARIVVENVKDCFAMGIKTVSLFAFSTENWRRPEDEVNFLMAMFEKNFKSEMPYYQRSQLLGNGQISPKKATKSYKDKHLILAIDYSGKFDILQACKSLTEKAKNGLIQVDDIDE